MTASVLQQLLALYFSIIYSWQLSSSEKILLGKKIHPFISRVLQIHISFILMLFSFSLTNAWLTCRLRKSYAVLWAGNHFDGSESPIDNTLDQFENLNSISNIFEETHDLLVFTDHYLFASIYKPPTRPGEPPSSHLSVTKVWFGLNIKYLSEPFFEDSCCRKVSRFI